MFSLVFPIFIQYPFNIGGHPCYLGRRRHWKWWQWCAKLHHFVPLLITRNLLQGLCCNLWHNCSLLIECWEGGRISLLVSSEATVWIAHVFPIDGSVFMFMTLSLSCCILSRLKAIYLMFAHDCWVVFLSLSLLSLNHRPLFSSRPLTKKVRSLGKFIEMSVMHVCRKSHPRKLVHWLCTLYCINI